MFHWHYANNTLQNAKFLINTFQPKPQSLQTINYGNISVFSHTCTKVWQSFYMSMISQILDLCLQQVTKQDPIENSKIQKLKQELNEHYTNLQNVVNNEVVNEINRQPNGLVEAIKNIEKSSDGDDDDDDNDDNDDDDDDTASSLETVIEKLETTLDKEEIENCDAEEIETTLDKEEIENCDAEEIETTLDKEEIENCDAEEIETTLDKEEIENCDAEEIETTLDKEEIENCDAEEIETTLDKEEIENFDTEEMKDEKEDLTQQEFNEKKKILEQECHELKPSLELTQEKGENIVSDLQWLFE
jgi:hypothetical protein